MEGKTFYITKEKLREIKKEYEELLDLEHERLKPVRGYKRMYNEVVLGEDFSSNVKDGWITAKIRSQIFADDSILTL